MSLIGRHSLTKIFADWIQLLAYEILMTVDEQRAGNIFKRMQNIRSEYSKNELNEMVKLTELLVNSMEEELTDVLGYVYMKAELGNKNSGQFFTPYSVCQLMAALNEPEINTNGIVKLNEPAIGAGGIVIAYCEHMKKQGINYQTQLLVCGQDIDFLCVCMSYVQFSLYGIPAIIKHGDTLSNPYTGEFDENTYVTPLMVPVLRLRANNV